MRERKSRKGTQESPRRKKKSANRTLVYETTQLFDLAFKLLIQDASSLALVQLINGLFGKSFSPDTKIEWLITEHVVKRKGRLVSIRSDCILKAAGQDFMIEVQIKDDRTIALRIFDYGIAHARKTARSSEDGSVIVLTLPDPKVIYLEPTKQTSELITSRLTNPQGESLDYTTVPYKVTEGSFKEVEERNLYLLLPFYLLLYRQEVKSPLKYGRSRKELACELDALIEEAEEMLERGLARGVLTDKDVVLVLERIEQMRTELYGSYREFQEGLMRLQTRLKSKVLAQFEAQEAQFKAREQEIVQKTFREAENKILDLFKQGYSLEEVERLLAEEAGTQTSSAISQ
ncbi:hypothetical protein FACS1894200_12600 [Spirochaetia bacterium]|nr:hypothetical protein FACS1894200_12600 [Spirochaetia bacterium]